MYSWPIFRQLVELLHWILVSLHDWFSSIGLSEDWTWGLAIIGLTIIVRLILFPLTWKQYKSSQAMQVLQPHIKELQRKYKDDRAKLQQETMKLYQEHKVNPFASCLPLLLQLPVFIGLYVAISGRADYLDQVTVQALKNASFLWIPKLGEPDPTYILLVLYIVTQMISTELMLASQSDPTQRWLMRAMPLIFVVFLFNFPSGLFVYWVTTNIWTIGQQLVIRRTMPKPAPASAGGGGKGGGAKAAPPKKRGRFMESMMAAQEQRMKDRQRILEEKSGKTGGGSAKPGKPGAGTAGQGKASSGKPGASRKGGKRPPPGKTAKPKPKTGGSGTTQ